MVRVDCNSPEVVVAVEVDAEEDAEEPKGLVGGWRVSPFLFTNANADTDTDTDTNTYTGGQCHRFCKSKSE